MADKAVVVSRKDSVVVSLGWTTCQRIQLEAHIQTSFETNESMSSSSIRPWATGPQPRFSTGIEMWKKGTPMEGGIHRNKGPNHWQENRDSHLTRP